ncbi:outer membrane beta-barrel protein [Urechidicola croceus]|uniref:Outer membrane protein beta-barrel domain-containing protein n=1 Tax=Urechidicola croceus TaxID=1850246 RepID=A0A1D8P5K5_9FLAO|nr:outer membrane beta-barrel protein [Urechidicola croceus]AOW19868.1 hypothetical protein LPB138_03840 [Urechidicola croceus]
MKKLIVLCAFVFGAISVSNAQLDFGIKGGLNFSTNGDAFKILEETADNITNPSSKTGYHLGVYVQTGGDSFYLRPELVYTKTKSDYQGSDFDMSKLDMPILLGYKIFNPVSVFAGPSLQYILDTDFKATDFNLSDAENDFTVGINLGVAVQLNSFSIDARYEKGLTENLASRVGIAESRLDTRPEQFILSLSFKL